MPSVQDTSDKRHQSSYSILGVTSVELRLAIASCCAIGRSVNDVLSGLNTTNLNLLEKTTTLQIYRQGLGYFRMKKMMSNLVRVTICKSVRLVIPDATSCIAARRHQSPTSAHRHKACPLTGYQPAFYFLHARQQILPVKKGQELPDS